MILSMMFLVASVPNSVCLDDTVEIFGRHDFVQPASTPFNTTQIRGNVHCAVLCSSNKNCLAFVLDRSVATCSLFAGYNRTLYTVFHPVLSSFIKGKYIILSMPAIYFRTHLF